MKIEHTSITVMFKMKFFVQLLKKY